MADGAGVFQGPAARIRGSSKAPSLGGASDKLQGLSYASIPGAGGTDSALWLELTTERGRNEPGRTGVKTFVSQVQNQGSADQDALDTVGFGYHCSDPEPTLSRAPLHRPVEAVASRPKPPHSCAGKEGGPRKPEVAVLARSAAQRGTRRRLWPRCLLGRPSRVSAGSWARPAAAPDARPRGPASPAAPPTLSPEDRQWS